jgi:hypothetical protein
VINFFSAILVEILFDDIVCFPESGTKRDANITIPEEKTVRFSDKKSGFFTNRDVKKITATLVISLTANHGKSPSCRTC